MYFYYMKHETYETLHSFHEPLVYIIPKGLISEEVEIFVSASLAMKLREYTRNTPIRRNPVSKF